MSVYETVKEISVAAKAASRAFSISSTDTKNRILSEIAARISENTKKIIEANKLDIECAQKNGIPTPMLDRLMLNEGRIKGICDSLYSLVNLPDPIGSGDITVRPNGLNIRRTRVPIGVVGIIYEARPNVTVDAAALCIKTGNATLLRGGREAENTNACLIEIMKDAIEKCGVSPDILGFIPPASGHESANALMDMRGSVDVLIPRGSKRLIDAVVKGSRVPVIETGAGNCHLYVHSDADIDMAIKVAINAKCSRPAVCNAIETLLVHKDIAPDFLPRFEAAVREKYTLDIRACDESARYLSLCAPATESDYETEYDDYILAIKCVDNLDAAITHINKYNTGHSEAIITRDLNIATKFQSLVDAAAVYVNASTRFTDGGEFGFGAEIGISTQKLHARGPMGLSALTTEKYLICGEGQIR